MKKPLEVRNWTIRVRDSEDVITQLEHTSKLYKDMIDSRMHEYLNVAAEPVKIKLRSTDNYESVTELISDLNELSALLNVKEKEKNKELQYNI